MFHAFISPHDDADEDDEDEEKEEEREEEEEKATFYNTFVKERYTTFVHFHVCDLYSQKTAPCYKMKRIKGLNFFS